MKRVILFFSLIVLFLLSFEVDAKDKVKLKADNLNFDESTHWLIASSNVVLTYGDVEIKANRVCLDTDNDVVWGTGNIQIRRGKDDFYANYFLYDLNKSIIKIKDVNILVEPEGQSKQLYLRAEELVDDGKVKRGKNGFFTSCDHPNPHYGIWANYFEYYPNERILGFNCFVYTPILFVPFGFWTPICFYELGDRRVIWNIPTMGEKKTRGWGAFMQNTIDYDRIDGKDSSVFVDFYEFNKVIDEPEGSREYVVWSTGLGFRHQYKLANNKGAINYYQLKNLHTNDLNLKRSWEQEWQISDDLSMDVNYSFVNGERINGTGHQNRETQGANVKYDHLGDKYSFNVNSNQDLKNGQKSLSLKLARSFNSKSLYNLSLNQNENLIRKEKRLSATLIQTMYLEDDASLRNTLRFNRINKESYGAADDRAQYTAKYTKKIDNNLSLSVEVDQLIDIDGDAVTEDIRNNDFFYKQPEVNVNYTNSNFGPFNLRESFTVARYQEVKYQSSYGGTQRVFPEATEFGIEPNTYIFDQSLSSSFGYGFSFNAGYKQYIFKTPGRDLFNGDALYKYNISLAHSNSAFGFMKNETSLSRDFSPKDKGNSPFFRFDGIQNADSNGLREKITFFLQDISKYSWDHAYSYNWVTDKFSDYNTSLKINPNKFMNLRMSISKDLEEHDTYSPLTLDISSQPTKNMRLNYYYSQDVMVGKVSNTYFSVRFVLGGTREYQWEIEGYFNYIKELAYDEDWSRDERVDYKNNVAFRALEPVRYSLQTYKIIKREHCRTFEISYNKQVDELRFKITILAFPEDAIGFMKNKREWKLEGLFDDTTSERL
jgi:lipopolysaccharide export system protein LptA